MKKKRSILGYFKKNFIQQNFVKCLNKTINSVLKDLIEANIIFKLQTLKQYLKKKKKQFKNARDISRK